MTSQVFITILRNKRPGIKTKHCLPESVIKKQQLQNTAKTFLME